MHPDTAKYNKSLEADDREICDLLAGQIDKRRLFDEESGADFD
jgi:hypothetical protein